jgi:hypothetical protein
MKKYSQIAMQDWLAGMTQAEIAEKYGVSQSAVAIWSTKHGWKDSRKEQAFKVCEEIKVTALRKQIDMAKASLDDCNFVMRALANYTGKAVQELMNMTQKDRDSNPYLNNIKTAERVIRMTAQLVTAIKIALPVVDDERVKALEEELKTQSNEIRRLQKMAEKAYGESSPNANEPKTEAAPPTA